MGLDQSRLDGEGMKIVLYLFKQQPKSSINWENGFVRCYKLCTDSKPAVEYQFSEFWCLSENRLMYSMCVCMCVCVHVCRASFGIAWRPVGNADSISGELALAEQMVCMIGPYQLQGHPRTHRKTHRTETYICVCVFVICVICIFVRALLFLKVKLNLYVADFPTHALTELVITSRLLKFTPNTCISVIWATLVCHWLVSQFVDRCMQNYSFCLDKYQAVVYLTNLHLPWNVLRISSTQYVTYLQRGYTPDAQMVIINKIIVYLPSRSFVSQTVRLRYHLFLGILCLCSLNFCTWCSVNLLSSSFTYIKMIYSQILKSVIDRHRERECRGCLDACVCMSGSPWACPHSEGNHPETAAHTSPGLHLGGLDGERERERKSMRSSQSAPEYFNCL